MPDGVKSIGDIKIVVDAETQQFAQGITDARSLVASMVGEGNSLLATFDSTFLKLGNTVGGLPTKIAALQSGFGLLSPHLQLAIGLVDKLAEKTGSTESLQALKSELSDLGSTANAVASAGFDRLSSEVSKLKSAMLGAGTDAGELEGRLGAVGVAAKSSVSIVIDAQTDGLREVNATLKYMLGDADKLSDDQINRNVERLRSAVAQMRKDLEPGHETPLLNRLIFGADDPGKIQDEIEKVEQQIAHLLETLSKREPIGEWLTETFADISKHVESAKKQLAELQLQNETLGMSKPDAAAHLMKRRVEIDIETRGGVPASPEQSAEMDSAAAGIRAAMRKREAFEEARKDADRQQREQDRAHQAANKLDDTFDKDMERMQSQMRLLTMTREEATAATYAERLLQQARRDGLEVTEQDIEGINRMAAAYASLTETVKRLEDQKRQLAEVSHVVSGSIMNEFSSWTRGAEFNVRRMTANILADFSKLIMQRTVLDPLFGSNASGGIGGGTQSGGEFGKMLSSIFDGFRADGGPVDDGRAYIVGERGPELFMPRASGTIVPNGALTGGAAPSVTVAIDARGATVDAVKELERLKAELPGIVINTVQDARERSIA